MLLTVLIVEFNGMQMRRVELTRNHQGEQEDAVGRFYGGIRKIQNEQEIDTWSRLISQLPVQHSVFICISG